MWYFWSQAGITSLCFPAKNGKCIAEHIVSCAPYHVFYRIVVWMYLFSPIHFAPLVVFFVSKYTCFVLWITFIFDGCHCSLAMVTTFKSELHIQQVTSIFILLKNGKIRGMKNICVINLTPGYKAHIKIYTAALLHTSWFITHLIASTKFQAVWLWNNTLTLAGFKWHITMSSSNASPVYGTWSWSSLNL